MDELNQDDGSSASAAGTRNELSGIVVGPAVMGRDISVTLPAQVPSSLNGLRGAAPEFVGRAEVLAELLDLLAPTDGGQTGVVRVSAVAGLGGVGKTELALQAAHEALRRGWFGGGALMVDLHGYEPAPRRVDAAHALNDLLQALSVPGQYIPADVAGRQRMFRAIVAEYAARGRPILVVLDNASLESPVEELLPGAGVAVVTSRHRLAGLPGRLLGLTVLDDEDSTELLGRLLALKLGPSDTRVADHPQDAARVAELCAGLPLAVEIVAALLAAHPGKPLAHMAEQLEAEQTRLAELEFGDRAVQAVFQLSYRDLTDVQQWVFRMMTVNPGPKISTDAVRVLTGLDRRAARTAVEALAQAHLIEPAEPYGWWRMHDLVRLYAAGLAERYEPERDQALSRLLQYYLDTTRVAGRHLDGRVAEPASPEFATREQALEWLDAEFANLVAATRAAADLRADIAVDLPLALWFYLGWRRLFHDWIVLATLALEAVRRSGDRHGEARALNDLGLALRQVRRFEEAVTVHQEAVDIFLETHDRENEGPARNNLGLALHQAGRHRDAIAAHEQAMTICHETDDRYGEGQALNSLGSALVGMGRYNEAIIVHQQAAIIFRELGDRRSEGAAFNNLGLALARVGRSDEAIVAHGEDLAIRRELDDRHGEAEAVNNLALALAQAWRFEEAAVAHRRAADLHAETGDRHGEGVALMGLGRALRRVGRADEAVAVHTEAAAVFKEVGDSVWHREALSDVAADEASRVAKF